MESMKVGAGLLADKSQDTSATGGGTKTVTSNNTSNIIGNNNFGLGLKDEQLQDGKPFQ